MCNIPFLNVITLFKPDCVYSLLMARCKKRPFELIEKTINITFSLNNCSSFVINQLIPKNLNLIICS